MKAERVIQNVKASKSERKRYSFKMLGTLRSFHTQSLYEIPRELESN